MPKMCEYNILFILNMPSSRGVMPALSGPSRPHTTASTPPNTRAWWRSCLPAARSSDYLILTSILFWVNVVYAVSFFFYMYVFIQYIYLLWCMYCIFLFFLVSCFFVQVFKNNKPSITLINWSIINTDIEGVGGGREGGGASLWVSAATTSSL